MILIISYLIFSFILDGVMSNYVSINLVDPSIFRTIYSIIAIVVIYDYFKDDRKYLYIILILGILFDIVYTNTFILNIIIFLIIYLILEKLDYLIPTNLLTINLKALISIFIYHIMTYLILLMVHYNNYNLSLLWIIIIRSIIMTIIYTSISYIIIKKIADKKNLKKIK